MTSELLADSVQSLPYNNLRGSRGPGISYAAELENRMPIRQEKLDKAEKLSRRELKSGLRSIFRKPRSSRHTQTSTPPASATKSTGSRTSRTRINQSQQRFQHDSSLPTDFSWKPLPIMMEDPEREHSLQQHETAAPTRKKTAISRYGRQTPKDSSSGWSLPPLFKAYPQAIRHATLPATSLTAEVILRINDKKNSLQAKGEEGATVNAIQADDDCVEGDKGKPKKRSRRNQTAPTADFEWTAKTYILVTSGYLLQYSGEGNFDRLPEKFLRLGPSSAAFATDAIPGRHWVVQVSSVADVDEVAATESRSIFSKLTFRMPERRTATNLLMVFESAESMEAWITSLRTEIEKQGGKRKLSETGKPNTDNNAEGPHRETNSHWTTAVRDPPRFANSGARTSHLPSTSEGETRYSETSTRTAGSETTRNQFLDDRSTTNSIVSQDERQLESLRENSNRLSCISSGQRTFVTSTGTSPDGSPTRETFGDVALGIHETTRADARTRPNAAEIATRRESVQATYTFLNDGNSSRGNHRAMPHCVPVIHGERMASPVGGKPTPNFSVPHASSRRYSYVSRPGSRAETTSPSRIRESESSPRRCSRIVPTAIQSARRLSAATDQSVTRSIATDRLPSYCTSPTSPIAGPHRRRWRSVSRERTAQHDNEPLPEVPRVGPGSMTEEVEWRRSPRKHASTSALKQETTSPSSKSAALPTRRPHIASMLATNVPAAEEPRGHRMSFLDVGDCIDEQQIRPLDSSRAAKRVSTGSVLSEQSSRSCDVHDSMASSKNSSDSCATITCSAKPESGHYLNVERTRRCSLMNRRSMPQIAASGPPPAPPPTRALPPIPRKLQVMS
ncbi:hypothetical protein C2857_007118 [Epichloe festucae Fl1]|uniref:PH domain-containing protein n=1 Tax=Epichloe festucae (strain Fl1) TaxID=877507 RepID=A0A7S9KM41_EPIFF|nr:hypothetical protein C2857_007118 [Epichloe festucae Fl1]